MSTLFISDLHLSAERPHITALFIEFLQGRAREAEALYILGDLFEAWLGDDMILPEYQDAIAAMKALSDSGVPLYLMHGNRDFLMGTDFSSRCGADILPDPTVIELYGRPTLLMHGDTLCTDDVEYMKFRAMVRNPAWQEEMLSRTPQQRLELARELREISKTETGAKAEDIMDVNAAEVDKVMCAHHVQQLIHGHTHRPAIHDFQLDGQAAQRLVLGDWYTKGSVLICEESGCRLEEL